MKAPRTLAELRARETQELIDRMGWANGGPPSGDVFDAICKLHERVEFLEISARREKGAPE